MSNLSSIGNIWTHCDWCGQRYQEDAETFMDIEIEDGEHLCPDCDGQAEVVIVSDVAPAVAASAETEEVGI